MFSIISQRHILVASLIVSTVLVVVSTNLYVTIKDTNKKVSILLQTHDIQKNVIASQKESIRSLTNELEMIKKYGTTEEVNYDISWESIPSYELVNDLSNDTWQTAEFVPDETHNNKKQLITYNDFPDISFEKNCVENGECIYDYLHADEAPNSFVWYKYHGVKVKIPYNPIWGNNTSAVVPYTETPGDEITWMDVDVSVRFGAPYVSGEGDLGWVPGSVTLDIYTYDEFQDFYDGIRKGLDSFLDPQKLTIEGGTILQFGDVGLGTYKNIIFITDENVVFHFSTDEMYTYEQIEDIVRTIEFN